MHGWQDYNVKQSEGVDLYEALPLPTTASASAPFKRLYLFQGAHQSPSGRPHFDALLDEFFDTTLRGAPPGEPVTATVTFSPQDHTVAKGHRIGLVLAGSNTVWAVPDTPAGTTTTVRAGTLVLPTAP